MTPPRSAHLFAHRFAGATVALATLFVVIPLRGQTPEWQAEMAKADAAYNDAVEKLADRRRAALQEAGDAWIRAIENEVAETTRAGDTTLAKDLRARIAATRQEERVPPARPSGIVTFGRHEYALIDEPKTWMQAKEHCERLGGHLLIVDTAAEEAFILSNLAQAGFWIGATDLWTPGRTVWLDGKPFQGFAAKVELDSWRNVENGIAWSPRLKLWKDHADGDRLAFVCEWE